MFRYYLLCLKQFHIILEKKVWCKILTPKRLSDDVLRYFKFHLAPYLSIQLPLTFNEIIISSPRKMTQTTPRKVPESFRGRAPYHHHEIAIRKYN